MGWASGSELAIDMIAILKKEVPDEKARFRIYGTLLASLRNADWDTEDEAMGLDPILIKRNAKRSGDAVTNNPPQTHTNRRQKADRSSNGAFFVWKGLLPYGC